MRRGGATPTRQTRRGGARTSSTGDGTFDNDRPPILGVIGRESGEVRLRQVYRSTVKAIEPVVLRVTAPGTAVHNYSLDGGGIFQPVDIRFDASAAGSSASATPALFANTEGASPALHVVWVDRRSDNTTGDVYYRRFTR